MRSGLLIFVVPLAVAGNVILFYGYDAMVAMKAL